MGLVIASVDHRLDGLVGLQGKHIMDENTLGGTVLARDFVRPNPIYLSPVGEEEQIGVRRGMDDVVDDVIFTQRGAADTATAPALCLVCAGQNRLHVTGSRHGDHDLLVGNQVLERGLAGIGDDPRPTGVTIFGLNLAKLLGNQHPPLLLARQQSFELSDERQELRVFLTQLSGLERRQAPQRHVEDVGRLDLGKLESLHQAITRRPHVRRRLDDLDDFVDVVEGDEQPFDDMSPGQRLFQPETAPPLDHFQLVIDVVVHHLGQVESARHSVDQRHLIHREALFELSPLEQLVQHHLRVRIPLQLEHEASAVAV